MIQLEKELFTSVDYDGFPNRIPYKCFKEEMFPIASLCLTDELHPTTALKTFFNHLEQWNDFFTGNASLAETISKLSTTDMELVSDIPYNDPLVKEYSTQVAAIASATVILRYKKNMDLYDVITKMNESDIWADIACNGRNMGIDTPWSTGLLLVQWMYPDEELFISYDEWAQNQG